MQQQSVFQKFLPHFITIAVFIVLSCAFCYPAFQGNTLNQHDMFTWLYASQESREFYKQTGENALWANNMFGGMPQVLIDFYPQTSLYHKLNGLIQFYTHGSVPNPATFFFLAMISFYILMCTLKVNRWLGAIGAIAFAFSSYNPQIISAGHTTKMLDIAFLPAIVAGVIMAYKGKYLQGAALCGLFMAFFVDTAHYQIVYYGMIFIGVLVVAMLIDLAKKGQFKQWLMASIAIGLAAGFAVLASSSRLIQTMEYNPYSTRGGKSELAAVKKEGSSGLDKEYAFRWSIGMSESLCLLVPNLYGGASAEDIGTESAFGEKLSQLGAPPQQIEQITANAPLYWGPQQEDGISGPVYFGAVVCLLFVLSLFVIRSKHKWWIAGIAFFFLLLAMGKHFALLNNLMFDYFPGYSKFRTPSMAVAVPSIIFPVLAIWALKEIFTEQIGKEELWKKLKISVIITGGLCLLILIATKVGMDYKGSMDSQIEQSYGAQAGPELMKAIREDRASAASGDSLRSLIFVLLAGGVLWAFSQGKLKKEMAIGGLALLIALDMIPVAHRYLNESNFIDDESWALQFSPSPADAMIMQDKDPYYRVFDLTKSPFNDSKPSNFHKSIGGYHGAKMQIYQELIEHQIGKLNSSVLNMLNTKYLITPGQKGEAIPQPNPNACGNAWFVSEVNWVNTADQEMAALNAPSLQNPMDSTAGNFNPVQTAILRDTYKSDVGNYNFGKDSAAYVRLAPNGYSPRRLKFESNNSHDGLAVFSDIYYPVGWKATIDGKEVPIMRSNYVLRALKIPAGKHNIEFSFNPPGFEKGERVALIGNILLTLMILAGIWAAFFRKQKEQAA